MSPQFSYYRTVADRQQDDLAGAIRDGLGTRPCCIPSRFFYDAAGSALFQDICMLPEYYQTRTETAILESMRDDLVDLLCGYHRLVELGSGASDKTRHILDVLTRAGLPIRYIPIDISDVMAESAGPLIRDYPDVTVTGIVDTYEGGMDLLRQMNGPPTLMMFLGSSLGNMDPAESATFMRTVRGVMRPQDMFLVGLDMVKDVCVLEAAYNDSAGVTARFNKNMLRRINRDLNADFDVSRFSHRAPYNADEGRIEMHLVSDVDQAIRIPGADMTLQLRRGEYIHTENSYKYTKPQIAAMARGAKFNVHGQWEDRDEMFSVTLMKPA